MWWADGISLISPFSNHRRARAFWLRARVRVNVRASANCAGIWVSCRSGGVHVARPKVGIATYLCLVTTSCSFLGCYQANMSCLLEGDEGTVSGHGVPVDIDPEVSAWLGASVSHSGGSGRPDAASRAGIKVEGGVLCNVFKAEEFSTARPRARLIPLAMGSPARGGAQQERQGGRGGEESQG